MKRIFSALLALSLFTTTLFPQSPILSTTHAQGESSFIDVDSDHEYREDINYLKTNQIVEGYELEGQDENVFRADYQLNRAELTKIMVESQYSDEQIMSCWEDKDLKNWETMYFPDVKMEDWFAKYVCIAVEKNIIDGYPDGTFKPGEAVNFAEASKIISNTVSLNSEKQGNEIWYRPFIRALESREGIPPSIGSFGKTITRGEMARMIHAAKETLKTTSISLAQLETRDERADELPQVDSCNALIEKLELDQPQVFPTMMREGFAIDEEATMMEADTAESSTGAVAPGTSALRNESKTGADDFSTTNIQVAGVDEADIIKNDGKYIYLIKNDTIRIVEAYPASVLKELSTIEVDDEDFTPTEMYVDNNQMVIIGQIWRDRYYPTPLAEPGFASIMPRYPEFNQSRMKVYVYDIRDRANPKKQRSIEIEGNYSNSRKVGKNLYFVINQWIPYYAVTEDISADVIIPRFKDSARNDVERPLVRCMGIHYFPGFRDRNYLIVAGLDISDNNAELQRKVVIGSSQNIYASRENLYVAAPHYGEVVIQDNEDLFIDSESMTLVYRFSLNGSDIEYENQGLVPGNILNQFSMDESQGHFRIATTRDYHNPTLGYITDNNLYILNTASDANGNMSIIGKVENIAPGERIKSVRFMGKRAYMVTFKNVDPLFVIDVSSPTNPTILGKLKIPGWSDYLHPYDENHLIGFGREVDPDAENAERLTSDFLMGMKLSIFDVRDISNPKEIHKEIIGTRGTTSELLFNHKAILFDKSKDLLAFPITITELINPDRGIEYGNIQTTFVGGIVYDIDLRNGFTLKGKVTHYEDDSAFENSGEYFQGEYGRKIQRMIYIGEYLYSISPDFVRSFNLDTLKSINLIKLSGPRSDDVDYIEEIFF